MVSPHSQRSSIPNTSPQGGGERMKPVEPRSITTELVKKMGTTMLSTIRPVKQKSQKKTHTPPASHVRRVKKPLTPAQKFIKRPLQRMAYNAVVEAEKTTNALAPHIKKHKKKVLGLLGATMIAAGSSVGEQIHAQYADAQDRRDHVTHTETMKEGIFQRQFEHYQQNMDALFTTGDMSHRPTYPEALENPMYAQVIPTNRQYYIGPKTLSYNHEYMSQHATLDKSYGEQLVNIARVITKYQPIFEFVGERLDMPWQLVASIAARESSMYYVLDSDVTWQKTKEIEIFEHRFANGVEVPRVYADEAEQINREIKPILRSIPDITDAQREKLGMNLGYWILDAQWSVYEQTLHRTYKKNVHMGAGSHDIPGMLSYAELHNGLAHRRMGVATGYVYSGTSASTSGKYIRHDHIIGRGRFEYKADMKDPQPGVYPILSMINDLPTDMTPDQRVKFLNYMSSIKEKYL